MMRAKKKRRSAMRVSSLTSFERLPSLMEEIQVLWQLEGSFVWWDAEVLNLSNGRARNSLPTAVIRYEPKNGYPSMDYAATFHRAANGVKRLRHTNPASLDLTPWKFPEESIDDSIFRETADHSKTSPSPDDDPSSEKMKTRQSKVAVKQESVKVITQDVDPLPQSKAPSTAPKNNPEAAMQSADGMLVSSPSLVEATSSGDRATSGDEPNSSFVNKKRSFIPT